MDRCARRKRYAIVGRYRRVAANRNTPELPPDACRVNEETANRESKIFRGVIPTSILVKTKGTKISSRGDAWSRCARIWSIAPGIKVLPAAKWTNAQLRPRETRKIKNLKPAERRLYFRRLGCIVR